MNATPCPNGVKKFNRYQAGGAGLLRFVLSVRAHRGRSRSMNTAALNAHGQNNALAATLPATGHRCLRLAGDN